MRVPVAAVRIARRILPSPLRTLLRPLVRPSGRVARSKGARFRFARAVRAARRPLGDLVWRAGNVMRRRRPRKLAPGDGIARLAVCRRPLLLPVAETNWLSKRIISTGFTERDFTEVVWAMLHPGDTVLDVGASRGYFTCIFADRVGRRGRVHAFEPWPSACQYLESNVRGNRFRNVTIHGFGLMDWSGEGYIIPRTLRVVPGDAPPGSRQIKVVRLDELAEIRTLNRLDAVKIDIEGAELQALRGMRDTLLRHRPALLLEVHPTYLPLYGDSVGTLHAFLAELGYLWVVVEPGPPAEEGHHLVAASRARLREARLLPEGEHRLVFRHAGCADWRIRRGAALRCRDEADGVAFDSALGPDQSLMASLEPSVAEQHGVAFASGQHTRVSWQGVPDAPQVALVVYEYAGPRIVRQRSFPVREPAQDWSFVSTASSDRLKLGLRITGPGCVTVRELAVEQWILATVRTLVP